LAGDAEVIRLRDERLRIIRLGSILDVEGAETGLDGGLIVVVEGGREKVGLFVDELLGQQQIVIKSLETNFEKIEGVSGATILGDGRVALILDVAGVIRVWLTRQARAERRDYASKCLEEE
nr:chemotaxis protein CheW [Planctomycetota bacterium]